MVTVCSEYRPVNYFTRHHSLESSEHKAKIQSQIKSNRERERESSFNLQFDIVTLKTVQVTKIGLKDFVPIALKNTLKMTVYASQKSNRFSWKPF